MQPTASDALNSSARSSCQLFGIRNLLKIQHDWRPPPIRTPQAVERLKTGRDPRRLPSPTNTWVPGPVPVSDPDAFREISLADRLDDTDVHEEAKSFVPQVNIFGRV